MEFYARNERTLKITVSTYTVLIPVREKVLSRMCSLHSEHRLRIHVSCWASTGRLVPYPKFYPRTEPKRENCRINSQNCRETFRECRYDEKCSVSQRLVATASYKHEFSAHVSMFQSDCERVIRDDWNVRSGLRGGKVDQRQREGRYRTENLEQQLQLRARLVFPIVLEHISRRCKKKSTYWR